MATSLPWRMPPPDALIWRPAYHGGCHLRMPLYGNRPVSIAVCSAVVDDYENDLVDIDDADFDASDEA